MSTGASKFDLTLEMSRDEEGLFGQAEYSTELFDDGTIARLVGHYHCLLRFIVGAPDARLSRLPLLGAEERAGLIEAWSGRGLVETAPGGLVGGFVEAARMHADRVAVVYGDQTMTYGELDAASNRLARHLRELGVHAEVCVGLCVEPSLESGARDPRHPQGRRRLCRPRSCCPPRASPTWRAMRRPASW